MEADQFRSALKVKPFRPFTVNTSSGEKYKVGHPEAVWISPSGKTVLVHIQGEEVALMDMSLVAEIVLATAKAGRKSGD
jgi:hypothetical protein